MQFAEAQGFRMRTSDGKVVAYNSSKLRELIQNGNFTQAPIPEDELTSRAKSDSFVKILALLQILWFVVQLPVRAIQHYQITALEIMTGAFVFYSLFTYGLSWHQPQNIEYPVHLAYQGAAPAAPKSEWLTRLMIRVLYIEVGVVGLSLFLLLLSACRFGSIHCLAWNSRFPTSQERLAWRICLRRRQAYLLWGCITYRVLENRHNTRETRHTFRSLGIRSCANNNDRAGIYRASSLPGRRFSDRGLEHLPPTFRYLEIWSTIGSLRGIQCNDGMALEWSPWDFEV